MWTRVTKDPLFLLVCGPGVSSLNSPFLVALHLCTFIQFIHLSVQCWQQQVQADKLDLPPPKDTLKLLLGIPRWSQNKKTSNEFWVCPRAVRHDQKTCNRSPCGGSNLLSWISRSALSPITFWRKISPAVWIQDPDPFKSFITLLEAHVQDLVCWSTHSKWGQEDFDPFYSNRIDHSQT